MPSRADLYASAPLPPPLITSFLSPLMSTVCLNELVSRAQARTGEKLSLCLEYG